MIEITRYDMNGKPFTDYIDSRPPSNGGFILTDFIPFMNLLVARGFYNLGEGSFRRAFERKKIVIKVPTNGDGLIDNRVEARAWQTYKNKPTSKGIWLAPCRLLPNGCLMMFRVEKYFDFNLEYPISVPQWIKDVDGWQVGKLKDKVLAYDYALSIAERDMWEKEWGVYSRYYHGE